MKHSKWSGIPSPKSTIGIKHIRACTRIRIKDLMQGPDVLDATHMEYVFNLTHPEACRGWASPRSNFPGSRTARITLGTVVCDDSRTNQQGDLKIVGLWDIHVLYTMYEGETGCDLKILKAYLPPVICIALPLLELMTVHESAFVCVPERKILYIKHVYYTETHTHNIPQTALMVYWHNVSYFHYQYDGDDHSAHAHMLCEIRRCKETRLNKC